MSLFGDLPQAKTNDGGGPAWAGLNKLQPPPRKPAAPAFGLPPALLRAGRGGARTPLNPGRGAGRGIVSTPSSADNSAEPSPAATPSTTALSIFSPNGQIKDEYDPCRPNDYEKIIADRERRKREAQEEAERQAMLKEQEEEMRARNEAALKAAAAIAARLASQAPPGALSEPPSPSPSASASSDEDRRKAALGLSGEEAFLRRGMLSRPPPSQPSGTTSTSGGLPGLSGGLPGLSDYADDPPGPGAGLGAQPAGGMAGMAGGAAGAEGPKGMSLAEKMLKKMGWREGEGLGKHGQGIATPLVAQKVAAGAGVIVAASEMAPPEKRQRTGAVLQGKPSRVIVIRNAVAPGQVDDDLEEEMGEELSKYGKVADVVIFEVTTAGWPAEEAVRIFIQFERMESATKALVDLQGRFFAGRQLRVAFFDEGRMERSALAPQQGEFD